MALNDFLPSRPEGVRMRIIKKINDAVAGLEGALLLTIILLMVFGAFLQVILRFFDKGILWGDIFLRHLVLWVGFIGASLATRDGKHINVDVFARYLKKPLKNYVMAFIDLFSATVSWYLLQAAITFVLEEKEYNSIVFNDIPSWYFQIIIPIGFGLILIRFIISALTRIVDARRPEGTAA
ncbi:MAG TPA: TRAP transporter small permease [Caldithrix abyssi]|uniref:TRAP transporter small permease n=1 Tax=Caldithrix abyssi TaxID=187145 RepID=A0A7V5VFH4_CALAY|nr:TRAP transporter small permease [Caldithrix abyssi]